MASSPDFKVYRGNEYIASCKYAGDAAAIVGLSGSGTVKYQHRTVVWREGREVISAADSYDQAADIILGRVEEMHRRSFVAAYGKSA